MTTPRKVLLLSTLGAFAAASLITGCSKKESKSKVVWPAKPADGAPIAVVFVGLKKKGGERRATMRFFNFSDKAVKRVNMTLGYLDAKGQRLKDFPWGQMGMGNLVEAKAYAEAEVGAFLPKETKKVEARLRNVVFADGSKWRATQ